MYKKETLNVSSLEYSVIHGENRIFEDKPYLFKYMDSYPLQPLNINYANLVLV